MSSIRVDTGILNAQQEQLRTISRQLDTISQQVNNVSRQLSWKISSSGQIKSRLTSNYTYLEQMEGLTTGLCSTLGNLATKYQAAEIGNIGLVDKGQAMRETVKVIAEKVNQLVDSEMGTAEKSIWELFWTGGLEATAEGALFTFPLMNDESYFKFLSGEASASLTPKYGEYKDEDAIHKHKQDTLWSGKKVNAETPWYDKKGTILEAEAEAKVEGSVLEGRIGASGEYGNGSIEGKFLTGEAHAKISGGLYVYDRDKDGNVTRIFSPGVDAEIGASIAAITLAADGRFGLGANNNMLGVYGNAEGSALSAEAKAQFTASSGQIYGKASAEANLVEAKGSAGVSVLGTDIGVSGSVKVGIGAHAEAGFVDGKLKVDVGAAIGVGFSVGFEVDVSGTVDAVCSAAKSAWDFMTGWW